MQAAFQRYTDNAVSKTINFPNSASVEDIAGAYMLAYELGCKGITIYRDGSKENQVLSAGESDRSGESTPAAEAAPEPANTTLTPRARPQEMRGITERIRTGHGTMYITINFDDDKPLRGLYDPGQGWRLRFGPAGSHIQARLSLAPVRHRHAGNRGATTGHHLLPSVGTTAPWSGRRPTQWLWP